MAWAQTANIKGPKGDPGVQGPQGLQGPQGPAGVDGKGVEIAGSVPTYGDLPTTLTATDAGKGYLVDADGLLYVWDGVAFPANGAGTEFVGPEGPQGPAGTDGVSVTNAEVDASGLLTLSLSDTTTRGPWNVKGPQGDQGSQGIQGIQGPQGDQGAQGIQGLKGDTGDQGPQGTQGIQGLQGVAGARGTKWFTGAGNPGVLTDQQTGDLYLNTATGEVWKLA